MPNLISNKQNKRKISRIIYIYLPIKNYTIMKKTITLLLLFTITSLSGWAQSISFTSVPSSTEIGTILTVDYEYTIASAGQIYCGISLFDNWTYISFVNGQGLNPAPVGTNVAGTFNILIPTGTLPTASLTGLQNYKVILELKDASGAWLAGDYSVQNYDFIASTTPIPTISVTSLPTSTEAGTNMVVNYKYTAASAGKIFAIVTKNGGANAYDFISTVAVDQLVPAAAGTDVTGSFTLAIPANTTPTTSLTGNENYRVVLELKDANDNWLAGNYDNINYNITASTAPYISVTSIPSSTQAGTSLIINYKYTSTVAGKISAIITKNGGVNSYDYISTVVFDQIDPIVVGNNITRSISLTVPTNTTPTASLTGNENYRVVLELKDANDNWLAGNYDNINYNITASTAPYISVTSIPSSTQAGTSLIINYKYTSTVAGKISAIITKNGGVNSYDYISTVVFDQIDPIVVGNNITRSISLTVPTNTTPTASLTGNENYRVALELKDASNNFMAGDYSNINYTISQSLRINDFDTERFSVYPNPVENVLKIANADNLSNASFRILNFSGQTVQNSSSFNKEEINVSGLNTGVYLLSVDSDAGNKLIKFIKK